MAAEIVTISFFEYKGFTNKWWAFKQMQIAYDSLAGTKGMKFHKMLGSGGKRGFSIFPNFGVYGFLSVWEKEQNATDFFSTHPSHQAFLEHAKQHWTIYLKTNKVHGSWEGASPFQTTISAQKNTLIGVLTRATIYTKHLIHFWKFVPPVSASVHDKKGLLFSIGIGELPLVQQATFSLWESSELMMAYAYKSRYHREVVQKTRELGWYKEELFARFHPYKTVGSWQGIPDLQTYF
ncbi:MAG: hypothetical protein AAF849_03010 [Bacteroidota bacterium]